jgi:hypothetical protein
MTRSTQDARKFVQQLSALADRLAAQDVVVASLHCDWASFGSWMLQAQKGSAADAYGEALLAERWDTAGPDVLRIWWDGRERLLTIESAPTPPLSSPGPWTRQDDKVFENCEAATRFVEEHLGRWVRGEA